MNLERHLEVLWRHRLLVVTGLVLAVVVAFLATFKVSSSGLERRGSEVWSSTSQILVTQKGFPWGRVTLPSGATTGAGSDQSGAAADGGGSKGQLQFADPGRFVNLALLYSVISDSDQVRARLTERPGPTDIQTSLLDPTNSGQANLPIVTLTTRAATPGGARTLNAHTFESLRDLLATEQKANRIYGANRVLLSLVNSPSQAVLVKGRSPSTAVLAFLLCVIATLALAHVVEALGQRRRGSAAAEPTDQPAGTENGNGDGADDYDATPVFVASGSQQRV